MRKFAAVMLLLPLFLSPGAALADDDGDDDSEKVIGPSMVDESEEPAMGEPIDVSKIVITTQTAADRFVAATTPLVLALGVGSMGLVIYTMARGSKVERKD